MFTAKEAKVLQEALAAAKPKELTYEEKELYQLINSKLFDQINRSGNGMKVRQNAQKM